MTARQWLASLFISLVHLDFTCLPEGFAESGVGVCLFRILFPWFLTSVPGPPGLPVRGRSGCFALSQESKGMRGTRCVFSASPPAAVPVGLCPLWCWRSSPVGDPALHVPRFPERARSRPRSSQVLWEWTPVTDGACLRCTRPSDCLMGDASDFHLEKLLKIESKQMEHTHRACG